MIHKNRENRRYIRNKKIEKRLRIMKENGEQMGSLYEKHTSKIKKNGGGYMSKHGTLIHYSRKSRYGRKVRENTYGPSEYWDPKSKKQMDEMDDQLKELENNFESNLSECDNCYYEEQYMVNNVLSPICVHIQSMKGEEAISSYELCRNVPKNCPYFVKAKITCKECLDSKNDCNCSFNCPKRKEET